jgi:hypothetical protein
MENSEGKIKELDETMENLDLEGTKNQTYLSQKDFTTRSGGISSNIHQLCVIITKVAEENDHADSAANPCASRQIKEQQQKREGENPRLHQRVENYHVIRLKRIYNF